MSDIYSNSCHKYTCGERLKKELGVEKIHTLSIEFVHSSSPTKRFCLFVCVLMQ